MHIRPKKSLGQNFLIDREVLEKIVSTTDIVNKDVLEIGPGSGNLTTYILKQKPKKLYVVEKDDDLAILLSNFSFNNMTKSSSFSTTNSFFGFCFKMYVVRFPLPGPISKISLNFLS